MEGIQVSLEKAGSRHNISVIKVGGYIDTTTSAELEHSLSSLLKSNSYNIIIDLGNVDYISSAGWGIFISEIKGIRERGGDLKLVRMIPDVFEVFELLEFHYILKAFDTLEEAVSDFSNGVSETSDIDSPVQRDHSNNHAADPDVREEVTRVDRTYAATTEPELETIEEKLRQIIIEKPDIGTFKILKILSTPRFGSIRLNWFELRKFLKQLNLDSKKKRMAYFRERTVR